jgi:hypothetical protein
MISPSRYDVSSPLEPDQPTEIELLSSQIRCYEQSIEILSKLYLLNNTSRTGSGKTVLTLKLAHSLNVPVAVFGPVASLNNWATESAKYGARVAKDAQDEDILMSYRKMSASQTKRDPDHGLLKKKYDSDGKFLEYLPTPHLDQLISEGCMFVFDESQNIVGDSYQAMASRCICNRVKLFYMITGTISKVVYLSATLVDKLDHFFNFLQLIGAMDNEVLYKYKKGSMNVLGFKEFYDFARMVDDNATVQYWNMYPPIYDPENDEQLKLQMWDFYNNVLKFRFTVSMEASENLNQNATQEIKNLYVSFPNVRQKIDYLQKIGSLASLVSYDNKADFINGKPLKNIGSMMTKLNAIHFSKRYLHVELAKNILAHRYYRLSDDEECWPKIVLYSPFLDVLDFWYAELYDYSPLMITGATKQKDRNDVVRLFNEPSSEYRILISTMQTGGVSINLHDTNGRYPRIGLCSTDYNIRNQKQTAGRFYREGSKGPSTVAFIFGDTELREESQRKFSENSIIRAIYRKGKIMKDFHSEQDDIFPCDYPDEFVKYDYVIIPEGMYVQKN